MFSYIIVNNYIRRQINIIKSKTIIGVHPHSSDSGIIYYRSKTLLLFLLIVYKIFHFLLSYHDRIILQTFIRLLIWCILYRVLNRFWTDRRNRSICYLIMKNLCSWILQQKLLVTCCKLDLDHWTNHFTNDLHKLWRRFSSKVYQNRSFCLLSIHHRSTLHLWNEARHAQTSYRIAYSPHSGLFLGYLPWQTQGQDQVRLVDVQILNDKFCFSFDDRIHIFLVKRNSWQRYQLELMVFDSGLFILLLSWKNYEVWKEAVEERMNIECSWRLEIEFVWPWFLAQYFFLIFQQGKFNFLYDLYFSSAQLLKWLSDQHRLKFCWWLHAEVSVWS